MIDRGDCDETTTPAAKDETSMTWISSSGGCAWARDTGEKYAGPSSWKLTSGDAGSVSITLCDNHSTSDMHGFSAGKTYRLKVAMRADDAYTSCGMAIGYYDGSDWKYDTAKALRPSQADTWEELEEDFEIPSDAEAVEIMIYQWTTQNKEVWIDDLEIYEMKEAEIEYDQGEDEVSLNKDTSISGGLDVDTDTLVVDKANNRVGIGTTSPEEKLDVAGNIQLGADNKKILFHDDYEIIHDHTNGKLIIREQS